MAFELLHLSLGETIVRLIFAVLAGGAIGYEREKKGRAAGFRTHILVAVGACVLALIQEEITSQVIQMANASEAAAGILSADNARITAQIVSGIGFLGAGTIVVSGGNVRGLTTAASIWAVAGLGIAFGMGFYPIAIAGLIIILSTLILIKKIFKFPNIRILRVEYENIEEPKMSMMEYLHNHGYEVMKATESLQIEDGKTSFAFEYKVDLKDAKDLDVMRDIQKVGEYTLIQLYDPNDEIE